MADSDTILQLGIEAAREGNREEARNLFSLLTRQEPDNLQAWLWYAGVAEGPDERRAALERVVDLDPNNEMARRGLQAMGVSPVGRAEAPAFEQSRLAEPAPADSVFDDVPEVPSVAATTAFEPERELTEDERLAAELDMAYDDYETVERAGPAFRNEPTPLRDERDEGLDAAAVGGGGRFGSRRSSRRVDLDDNDGDNRGRPLGLLIGLVLVILLLLCALIGWPFLFGGDDDVAGVNDNSGVVLPGDGNANVDISDGNANVDIGDGNANADTGVLTDTPLLPVEPPLTSTDVLPVEPPLTSTDVLTDSAPVEQPTAAAVEPPPPAGDLASANPQPVPVGQQISVGDWSYTFPNFCLNSCATVLGPQAGDFTAQGTYVVALVLVSNNSATEQTIPENFFVLKDAQGRIHTPRPQVSGAYVIRGVNADRSSEDPVQPGVANTSMPLVFDVPPDATDLVLFSSANPSQGFQILNAVQ